MYIRSLKSLGAIVLILGLLGGCVSSVTMSQIARSGDTVVIGLGGLLGQQSGPGQRVIFNRDIVRESEITVELHDSAGVSHEVKLRELARFYSDPAANENNMRNKGQWLAVIDLIHPEDGPYPPGTIATGSGTLHIFDDLFIPIPGFNFPLVSVSTEILPGEGGIQLNGINGKLSPAKVATIGIDGEVPPDKTLGAIEYTIEIPYVNERYIRGYFRRIPVYDTRYALEVINNMKHQANHVVEEVNSGTATRTKIVKTRRYGQSTQNWDVVLSSDLSAINSTPDFWQNANIQAVYYDTDGEVIADLSPSIGTIE